MSILSYRVTKLVDIPHDPPHTATIRKLSGRHLGKAHEAWLADIYKGVQSIGGAAVQKDMQLLLDKADAKESIKKVQEDPLNGYDQHAIVRYGLIGWDYEESVSPEAIEELDDESIGFFAREILRLTKPGLFVGVEEDQKNG